MRMSNEHKQSRSGRKVTLAVICLITSRISPLIFFSSFTEFSIIFPSSPTSFSILKRMESTGFYYHQFKCKISVIWHNSIQRPSHLVSFGNCLIFGRGRRQYKIFIWAIFLPKFPSFKCFFSFHTVEHNDQLFNFSLFQPVFYLRQDVFQKFIDFSISRNEQCESVLLFPKIIINKKYKM